MRKYAMNNITANKIPLNRKPIAFSFFLRMKNTTLTIKSTGAATRHINASVDNISSKLNLFFDRIVAHSKAMIIASTELIDKIL